MNSLALKGRNLPAPPDNEIAMRNRKILLEHLGGVHPNEIAGRYGISVDEIRRCLVNAFDDIKAADFHKDIRMQIALNIMADIIEIDNWTKDLKPRYKIESEAIHPKTGRPVTLKEDANDQLAFAKFKGEKRAQLAFLMKILDASVPEEADDTNKKIQDKMLDALAMSLKIQKKQQDMEASKRVPVKVDVVEAEIVEEE